MSGRADCLCLVITVFGAWQSAWAESKIIDHINIQQNLNGFQIENEKSPNFSEIYKIKCKSDTCIGSVKLFVNGKQFQYITIIKSYINEKNFVDLYINIRPDGDCSANCPPTINSIQASIAFSEPKTTVIPLKQYGFVSHIEPPGSTTDLLYNYGRDPVAFVNVSLGIN